MSTWIESSISANGFGNVDRKSTKEGVDVQTVDSNREPGWGTHGPHGDDGDGPRWGPGIENYIPPKREAQARQSELCITDMAFDADKPGYYIFDGDLTEKKCWHCGKKFTTCLQLLKFCSPDCKREYVKHAFKRPGA